MNFSAIRTAVQEVCTVCGAATGLLGIFAVSNPDAVGEFIAKVNASMARAEVSIAKIEANTGTLAESIPLWPLVEEVSLKFDPPAVGTIGFTIANPKNLLIKDFSISASVGEGGDAKRVTFVSPTIIPPNSEISPKADVLREDWFPDLLKDGGAPMTVCFTGVLENRSDTFVERRLYVMNMKNGESLLKERSFALDEDAACG